jgi:hypothetical protein
MPILNRDRTFAIVFDETPRFGAGTSRSNRSSSGIVAGN